MRVWKAARNIFLNHPVLWILFGVPLFIHLSRLPANSWNIEINIARNLIDGFGFVDSPLDPPALWRPPLSVALLVPIELLVHDPKWIYAVFGTLTSLAFLASVFYLMKMIGGRVLAHLSLLLLLNTPAFTALLAHQLQLLSYLLMFSLVSLSILATIWSWRRSSWQRDVIVGLCWGATFLARPESITLLVVSLFAGLAFHRSLGIARGRAIWSLALQLTAFLAIYEPSVLIFRAAQQRHNLYGQEALYTFYAGAHIGIQLTGDIEGDGYRDSVALYGSPAKFHNSMLRFMFAHPQAIAQRIKQNLEPFKRLLSSYTLIDIWNCYAFLIFSSILSAAKPPPIPGKILVIYFTLLLLASPYFLVFHVDVRYPLMFIVILTLWISVISFLAWTTISARFHLPWTLRCFTAFGLVLLCVNNVNCAIFRAGEMEIDITPWRQLATVFRANVRDEHTPVVGINGPDGGLLFGSDSYWFSYFSHTALPWCGDPGCDVEGGFPRRQIYSFLGKPQEYLWLPDKQVASIARPYSLIVQRVDIHGMGTYSLLRFPSK